MRLAAFEIVPPGIERPVARWDTNDGHAIEGYRTAGGVGWVTVERIAAFRFGREGPVEASSLGGHPEAVEDSWLRSVLPLVVQARGTQVLHASAVRGSAGVVALCGVSTAGKSTLAAALQTRGATVVADDALAFEVEDGEVAALTLPFQLRLRPTSAEALGLPVIAAGGSGGGRASLRGIVLLAPHDGEAAPTLVAVHASTAVGALMPHAYCFALDEGKADLVAAYAGLAGAVPVRWLRYPQRLQRLDEVAEVLAGHVAFPQ